MRIVDIDRVPVAYDVQYFDNDCIFALPKYVIEEIARTCSIEAEPIRYGEWIPVNDDNSLWKCSACKEFSCCASKYCSECGAKMKNGV